MHSCSPVSKYALLFIRGERPISDLKFDILKHPYIALTTDGGTEPFKHGEDSYSHASIEFSHDAADIQNADPLDEITTNYVFLSDEELEELINKMEVIQ